MKKFVRKNDDRSSLIYAIQLDFGTAYHRHGDVLFALYPEHTRPNAMLAKVGDWVVRDGDLTFVVDKTTFERSYRQVSMGGILINNQYWNLGAIWARQATYSDRIPYADNPDQPRFLKGDWLIADAPHDDPSRVLAADQFAALYESDEPATDQSWKSEPPVHKEPLVSYPDVVAVFGPNPNSNQAWQLERFLSARGFKKLSEVPEEERDTFIADVIHADSQGLESL